MTRCRPCCCLPGWMTNLTNYCKRRRLPPRPRAAHRPQSVRFSFTLLLMNLFPPDQDGKVLSLAEGRTKEVRPSRSRSLIVGRNPSERNGVPITLPYSGNQEG